MINEECEVIFLDEAHAKLMDIDDWKIVTQGGWTAHDEKFKTSRGFVNRCPMLVTSQEDIDFGNDADNEAMDTRLRRYKFRQLPTVVPDAFEWLKSHPVECIIWAMNHAAARRTTDTRQENDEEGQGRPSHTKQLTSSEERELLEVDVIRIIDSDEEKSEQECTGEPNVATGDVDQASPMSSSSVLDVEARVQAELESCHVDTLRHKHLSMMKTKLAEGRRRRLKQYKSRMIKDGLLTEQECQLIDDEENVPEVLQEKIRARIAKNVSENNAERKRRLAQELKASFENPWLAKTERDMLENQQKFENTDPALHSSLVEITVNKLKMYHTAKSYDVKSETALNKRKRLLEQLGYSNVVIGDLWSVPMVLANATSVEHVDDPETDLEDLSDLTQVSPGRATTSTTEAQPKCSLVEQSCWSTPSNRRRSHSQPTPRAPKRGRAISSTPATPSQPCTKRRRTLSQKTINDFFKSG